MHGEIAASAVGEIFGILLMTSVGADRTLQECKNILLSIRICSLVNCLRSQSFNF